jgi:hypothetical protein
MSRGRSIKLDSSSIAGTAKVTKDCRHDANIQRPWYRPRNSALGIIGTNEVDGQLDLFACDDRTRCDKLAANGLAFIKLAAVRIWIRAYESTP